MRRVILALTAFSLVTGLSVGANALANAKPKHTTKVVMKTAMKGELLKKVLSKKATKEEKSQFLDYVVSLYGNKPKKGDAASWSAKTGALVTAAAKVVLDHKDGLDALKKASNCKGCHNSHK